VLEAQAVVAVEVQVHLQVVQQQTAQQTPLVAGAVAD
jgi:hypothetical protein